ncbi:MAG: SDR family oxidoreductase [Pseudomonadota bacterium]
MPNSLSRRAVVTGGANGIGEAICRRLAADGFHVTLCDLDREAGLPLADEIGGVFAELDATDESSVVRFIADNGPVSVLVNNVGTDQHAFFTQMHRDDWRRLLAINLESTLAFTHAALPSMQENGYGRIINIGSEAGRLGSKGGSVYAAAKAGVIGFTKSIARENARYGVTANVVSPGPIETPLVKQGVAAVGPKLREDMSGMTLLRRLGEPQEVAGAVSFFASDDASYITGEVLSVSGGMGCGAS